MRDTTTLALSLSPWELLQSKAFLQQHKAPNNLGFAKTRESWISHKKSWVLLIMLNSLSRQTVVSDKAAGDQFSSHQQVLLRSTEIIKSTEITIRNKCEQIVSDSTETKGKTNFVFIFSFLN